MINFDLPLPLTGIETSGFLHIYEPEENFDLPLPLTGIETLMHRSAQILDHPFDLPLPLTGIETIAFISDFRLSTLALTYHFPSRGLKRLVNQFFRYAS